jgi:hypothetical protein
LLQKSGEFLYAIIAMVVIILDYFLIQTVYHEVPAASSFWGHALGVMGFILMLMTEVLYSLRKRSSRARWGRMSDWLEFHIFTGLVGSFMVLLHPGFQFRGLAGVLSLLTVLVVLSGFIGRYIYTAVPRTADGVEIDLAVLEEQAAAMEVEISSLALASDTQPMAKVKNLPSMSGVMRTKTRYLADLQRRRNRLKRVIRQRQTARRLFSLWHTIHIPLGLTLFTVAFVHIGAAIYYALLLK